ncbi:MAG: helix-turn-helix transcriptional regulator [Oscillospiraceae bacterium]|nr:helix-turn-helix transcriptional regulator [Oscillospiraceae bacterium]MDD4367920.1 helix-turn-helix transcriptional regulator [Oscillospiraceae bacterium]
MSKNSPEHQRNRSDKIPAVSVTDIAVSTTTANPHPDRINWIDAQKVGLLLRQIRQYQTRSQLDISTSANINSTYYCHLEAGKSRVSLYKLCDILEAMKIPAWHFIRWLQEGWTVVSLSKDLQKLSTAPGQGRNRYQVPSLQQEVAEPGTAFTATASRTAKS